MAKGVSEIKLNYLAFSQKVSDSLTANIATFQGNEKLAESYARIAAINALKIDIIQPHFPDGAAHFFYEAHNDALLSHVNASFGSWRPALQALRSFMENTMACIYYLDHPIEFEKWKKGDFYLPPKAMREYIVEHPKLEELAKDLDLKAVLDKEYSTLSKAVHGSSIPFRMTSANGKINIAAPTQSELGKWSARERSSVDVCITALVGVVSQFLDGAKMQNLRAALSIVVQANSRASLKKHLDVTISAP